MSTINDIIKEVIFESKEKNLKLFYKIDVLIKNQEKEEKNKETKSIYKQKLESELTVPQKISENIQTIQDLIDYLSDEKRNGEKIISPIIKEIILIATGSQSGALSNVIGKDDKVIIQIEYGNNKYDNIGFKINKNDGTDIFSITMIKDGEILQGNFNQALINKQILFYRNSVV